MIKSILSFCAFSFFLLSANGQEMKNAMDSVSYSAGIMMAQNLKAEGLSDVNADLFQKAIFDVLNNNETLMKPSDADMYFKEFKLKQKMTMSEANKMAGEQFLAENAKRDGVVSLDNGLQYEVLVAGDGPKPAITDKVYTHYHGTLIDGTVFDSSVDRGEAIEFPLNRVIRGWTEILQLMPVGSKWRVFIPYDLAYGQSGVGGVIGPYTALIFEIELIEIR